MDSYSKKRIGWVDALRGFAIFAIVLGHNGSSINGYLYSFHVPLFFFISGLMHKNYGTFVDDLKHKTRSILLPYFFLSSVLWLMWFFVLRHFGTSVSKNYSVIKNAIGLLYAQGGHEYMDWGGQMWFLPCLYVVSLLAFSILQLPLRQRWAALIISSTAGVFLLKYSPFRLPFSIDAAALCVLFYLTGYWFKNATVTERYSSIKSRFKHVFLLVSGIVAFFIAEMNTHVDLYHGQIGNPLLFVSAAVGSSVFYTLLFSQITIRVPAVEFFGRGSIVLFAFHNSALSVIKFVYLQVSESHLPYKFDTEISLLLAVLQCILVAPAIYIIQTYFPWVIGRKKPL